MAEELHIPTIADLERILDEHPQIRESLRRKLLTDEERELPRVVTQLAEQVSQLAQTMSNGFADAAADRAAIWQRVEQGFADAAADRAAIWQRVEQGFADAAADRAAIRHEMAQGFADAAADRAAIWQRIEQGFADAAADRAAIRQEMAQGFADAAADRDAIRQEMAQGFADADADRAAIRQEMAQGFADAAADRAAIRTDLSRISGTVSRLAGADYESHVAQFAPRYLRRELGIHATVFATQRRLTPLTQLLDEAEESNRIAPEQTDDVNQADLVLTDNRDASYIVAEISITVQQKDIDRAFTRAALLAEATGVNATPLAIGTNTKDDLNTRNVPTLIIPPPPPVETDLPD